jgi:hypothetical protein
MDLKDIRCEDVDWINLNQGSVLRRSVVAQGHLPPVNTNVEEFLTYMRLSARQERRSMELVNVTSRNNSKLNFSRRLQESHINRTTATLNESCSISVTIKWSKEKQILPVSVSSWAICVVQRENTRKSLCHDVDGYSLASDTPEARVSPCGIGGGKRGTGTGLSQSSSGFPVNIVPPRLFILYVIWRINNRPAGGRSSDTQ